MNPKSFNGQYRPLVKTAWETQSRHMGLSVGDRIAQDKWYRAVLNKSIGVLTTSGLHDADQKKLISVMEMLAESDAEIPTVHGWTASQNRCFQQLALEAYENDPTNGKPALIKWLEKITGFTGKWVAPGKTGRTEKFDRIMAELACIADNDYWLTRTATQTEIRLRWQIRQLLIDLDALDWTQPHTWAYVQSIWKQSKQLPADLNDAPGETLHAVYCMLDTHVRRLADKSHVDQADLHSRRRNAAKPVLL